MTLAFPLLAIDPGRSKCGVALVGAGAVVLHREVVPTERLIARILQLRAVHAFGHVLIGDGTECAPLSRALRDALPASVPVEAVPEAYTSQRARWRYLEENAPRGWARLLPRGLRSPDRPVDDYVAVLLAEDWLGARERQSGINEN